MRDAPTVGAFAIIPCNDIDAAMPFWARLGFAQEGHDEGYRILRGWGCELHLQPASEGWRVPDNNPFGLFIRTPRVDEVAARVEDLIIRPGGALRHREWGLYEFAVNGPDNLLVRVGWPSQLVRGVA